MGEKSGWSPTERVLYVAGVPVLVLLAVLLFLGVATSEKTSASQAVSDQAARLTPAQLRERSREATMKEIRQEYTDCLKGMGVNLGGVRTRFSRRPNIDKIRNASSVCQTIMRDRAGGTAPPTKTPAPTPNSL
jgi:hypothetical protein